MKKKQLKYLRSLLETPSATGCEQSVAAVVRERMALFADEVFTDTMGSVHATLQASPESGPDAPTLMLAAHMDEIGLMVRYISDDGFLYVSAVGGVDAAILPSLRVDVHGSHCAEPLRGVVARKPIHLISADERKNVTPLDQLVIDLGLPGKKVKRLVEIGDTITFAAGFEPLGNDLAVSRAFDDKCGVWVITRVLELLERIRAAPRPTWWPRPRCRRRSAPAGPSPPATRWPPTWPWPSTSPTLPTTPASTRRSTAI